MAGKDRAMIEKSDAGVVFKDDTRSGFAASNFAESGLARAVVGKIA